MKREKNTGPTFADQFRLRRRAAALDLFRSETLFLAGILTMPALLFNPSTSLRIAQFILFLLCAWLVGKRTSLLNTLIVSASIIGFNLIIPYGRVLTVIGGFRITEGALFAGIEKAVTVEGLIMLSKATVRSDLHLPGRFGALIGESFRYFELIMERKGGIERKDPIGGIDRLLMELSTPIQKKEAADGLTDASLSDLGRKPPRVLLGRVILVAAVALAWTPFFLTFSLR